MLKKIRKKVVVGLLALNITGTIINPGVLTISAARGSSESIHSVNQHSALFNVIDEVTLFDKRDQSLYIFDSNQDLLQYISASEISTASIIVPPTPYNQWKRLSTSWLSKSEVKRLAVDVRKAQSAGTWVAVAGAWLYKFPFLGATVSTIGALMQGHNQTIIDAANNNQSISIYHEQRVDWNGYGPRTRMRLVRHN